MGMPFISFGSKKGKIKKLIEAERFDEIVSSGLKDKKVVQALIELLDDPNPGIVGDSLLLLTNILNSNPKAVESQISEDLFKKLVMLMESRNPYVRENAMMLSYRIVQEFPAIATEYREWIVNSIKQGLTQGSKEQKGFLLIIIGELQLRELRPLVEELINVEDKVILPFEGKKWVPLGEIAKETLEKLS